MQKLRHTSARNSASVDRDADQAELLGEHREQEIGVRLGQIEELLHALAEAHAEPLAAADRDQRLRELEAAVVRVRPGIEERVEARAGGTATSSASSAEGAAPRPRVMPST